MDRRSFRDAALSVVLLAVLALAGPARAQNLYLDPGFEKTGVPGTARTGERAGHLAVGAANHWDAIGERLAVEPFARYRVTTWVKAKVGTGTLYAPYCYEWDSYEWAFISFQPITATTDWTRTEVTFVSPHETMYIHPLAYMDAAHCEAWVDDVVVEKIAGPEETMAALLAKREPTEDELRLIARWLVKQGKMRQAAALLKRSDGLVRADIATVLAQNTPQPRARRPYVRDVVAFGGPSYHQGMERFNEITVGMSDAEKVAICRDAVRLNPGLERAGRSVRLVIENLIAGTGPATLKEQEQRLRQVRRPLAAALAAIPKDSPSAGELEAAMKQVEETAEKLAARRQELGRCVVRIGGKTVTPATHAIVVPEQPTPSETYAARELQSHLELITGGVVPIRSEKAAGRAIPFYIGHCRQVKPDALRVETESLGLEGLHLKSAGPAVMLAGNQRGVLYAVYTLLEDVLGCRWFTPDCATWPKEGTIDVPALDKRFVPALEYRAGDYPIAQDGAFAARLRLNGSLHHQTKEQGGNVGVQSLAHTFASLVPPQKYFNEHPEYFSLVKGKRQSGYAQLCLTNPDVLRITIEGVRRWIKEMPDKTVFSVSQNDTHNYCECPECTRIAEEEGSQAGPLLRFVNAVADDIARDYPHIAIETLAYQYTRKPPKITKPRPNVIICLCSIECCFIHSLGEDNYNRTFADDIRGWKAICDRLWIWDYIINYAHSICPFPNLYVLKPNIQFFLANGVKGVYEESCYYTKGSELQELRNYVFAKLLWDPDYDTDKAIDEFCAAYYGPAAPQVRQYLNLIHRETQRDPNLHVTIYTHPRHYLTAAMLAEARAIFDQAEAAVKDDPVRLHRVQVARLPILYTEITLARTPETQAQYATSDVPALVDQFERIARKEGVRMVREWGDDSQLDAWLAAVRK
ncbi:MAG: DUF4838 domain-containing protein [Armatimonadetes bacterium]|nr:DUF4838 domain-containing protein [Armatimonadota bacterium]